MDRGRLIVAAVLTATLLFLVGWQVQRERLVRACLDAGGAWDGRACGEAPARPILLRDLRRS
jgi:hypothetical protein